MGEIEDLLGDIFDGTRPVLYDEFEAWVRSSRRFRAFAATYRDKMRAKLRRVRDEGGMKDLRAELEAAALLLGEERFSVEYEKYAASKRRGPDFTVTFKTHTPFNVEVRRIRSAEVDDASAARPTGKLIGMLCDKVGQMPPGMVNLLWLSQERGISREEVSDAMLALRELAEHKAEDFFVRRGFESAAVFLKQYRRLSGIVVRQSAGSEIWLNPLAQYRAPSEIVTAIQRLS